MLSIQPIPLNPSMINFQAPADRVNRNVATTVSDNNYNLQFGDYLLMHNAQTTNNTSELVHYNQTAAQHHH